MRVLLPLFALAAAAAAVVASGLATGGAACAAPSIDPSPGGYRPPPVTWSQCAKAQQFPVDFQCGTVTVPLKWANVGGEKIKLAVTPVVHPPSPSRACF